MFIERMKRSVLLSFATVCLIGFIIPGSSHSQSLSGGDITAPTDFPDDYNYETGELVNALKQNSTAYPIATKACETFCTNKPNLCNVRYKKYSSVVTYNSVDNLPKRWLDIQCIVDARQKMNSADLMQACVAGCTNAKCSNDDNAREACMGLCCDAVYEMKKPSSTASTGLKNAADSFINSCRGPGMVPWGICRNYLLMKGRDLDPPSKTQTKANVMMAPHAPAHMTNQVHTPSQMMNKNAIQTHDIKTLMNKSPMNSHPNMMHLQMHNNTMNEKMPHTQPLPLKNTHNNSNVRKLPLMNNKMQQPPAHTPNNTVKAKRLPLMEKPIEGNIKKK